MSIPSGERTFFHNKGANAEFCPDDIDVDSLNCNIFHIGYILLLDRFDEKDKQYGTVMARFLSSVQKRGIKTSIDLVSSSAGDYGEKVIPALRYCNYVIINEIECCGIWELEPRHPDGSIHVENVRLAMQKCIDAGVQEKVVVHCKEACFLLDRKGNFTQVPSLRISPEEIKGTVGAGDAFCAGCLYGIYHNYTDTQILEFASAAAACNLLEANAVDGMKTRNEILLFAEKKGRLTI
jgi:sugar/nucleoside kinase (ribokinase family)